MDKTSIKSSINWTLFLLNLNIILWFNVGYSQNMTQKYLLYHGYSNNIHSS